MSGLVTKKTPDFMKETPFDVFGIDTKVWN